MKEIEENNRMGKTRDLFKKIRDTKRTFHAKMGVIKDRNGMDLTEAEDTEKRGQEYIEELYKKDPHDQDNHAGAITHLEPDNLDTPCILSPYLFNLYVEYIMQDTMLDEAQAGIKIARKNINNLRYADDTTLVAESEELKSLLMKVKEQSEKVGIKLNSQKTNIIASGPIIS